MIARARGVERPFERDAVHRRVAGDIQPIHRGPQKRFDQIVFDSAWLRRTVAAAMRMHTRLHGNPNGEPLIQIRAEIAGIRAILTKSSCPPAVTETQSCLRPG